jgi:hypothetical protein
VPIPGIRKLERLGNLGAVDVDLSTKTFTSLTRSPPRSACTEPGNRQRELRLIYSSPGSAAGSQMIPAESLAARTVPSSPGTAGLSTSFSCQPGAW